MPISARSFPISVRVGFAALAVGVALALIQHQRSEALSGGSSSSQPLALLPAPYGEAEARDRDIEFHSRRAVEDPSSAIERYILAQLLFSRARYTGSDADLARAEELVRESIARRSQRNYQAFELLASLLMARHAFHEARAVALRLDSLAPGRASHLALAGEIELELGNYEAAAERFEGIQYDGRNFTMGARLARWYEVTGRIDTARRLLDHAIRAVDRRDDLPREQVAWFHYRLGELELRAGNVGAADSAFRAGLSRHPDDVRSLGGLSRAALERGTWKEAIDFGERALAIQLDPATLATISRAYLELGDTAQAASYAREISVSGHHEFGGTHRALGLFLLDHGTPAEREDILKHAKMELRDRKDVYGRDLLAWALYRNGRLEDAREQMARALSQNTEDVLLARHARAMGLVPSSRGGK